MTEPDMSGPQNDPSSAHPKMENRCGKDRRVNRKSSLKYLFFKGRRERIRREEDRARVFFFDRYPPKLFAAITTILMLSVTDALLTLVLIANGSSELNPVMAYFLDHSLLHFIIAKYVLTSIGVVVLLIFKNVFLSRMRIYTHSLFFAVIVAFAAVVIWEIFLIVRIL
jgi:hypothetical protein